jgi:hypothetical protein
MPGAFGNTFSESQILSRTSSSMTLRSAGSMGRSMRNLFAGSRRNLLHRGFSEKTMAFIAESEIGGPQQPRSPAKRHNSASPLA